MESLSCGVKSGWYGVEFGWCGVEFGWCGVSCHIMWSVMSCGVMLCGVEFGLCGVLCGGVGMWVCDVMCAVVFMRICTQTATNYVDREIKSIAKVLALLYELCCFKFYATTLRTPQQLCQVIPGKMTAK